MIALSLKLVLAHLIGDFLLQPNQWVIDKEEKRHKSPYLYWHILIHTVALVLLLQFRAIYLYGVVVIVVSHFIIDLLKLNLKNKVNLRLLFFTDQIVHLMVIVGVVYAYEPFAIDFTTAFSPKLLLFIISIITVTVVSSILMKVIITKWDMEEDPNTDSLENAGMYIGMLERLFVFGFIVTNHWQVIGLLLTAKSVFRFGDLSKSKDRKLTEYILIGTLLSFGLAIVIGLGYEYILAQLAE